MYYTTNERSCKNLRSYKYLPKMDTRKNPKINSHFVIKRQSGSIYLDPVCVHNTFERGDALKCFLITFSKEISLTLYIEKMRVHRAYTMK